MVKPTALLLAVASLSPAHSASLMNNAIRISPSLQFHSVSPNVQLSERPSLSEIHVTKPVDVSTPKLMTRSHPHRDFHITKHFDKATPSLNR